MAFTPFRSHKERRQGKELLENSLSNVVFPTREERQPTQRVSTLTVEAPETLARSYNNTLLVAEVDNIR